MKKRFLGILLSGVLAAAAVTPMTSVTAFADGQKVVTLGADLDEDQKNAVLRYFGILGQNVRTLTITNQDERNHLGSYVPLEQIGTHTFSCALVNPTNSGGIQVKTANLTWVTGNMIASTLSTSGVVNCEVLAAAPFEVSGTGALTGVIMAYESASGTTLSETKKDIATQELVTTTTLANTVGTTDATNIVNEIKIQVIEGQVVDPYEVEEIVDEVITSEAVVALTDEDRALLNDLANRIAEQQYDYDTMKETLERVEQNVNVSVNVEQPAVNVTVSNDANNASNNANTNTNDTNNTSTNTSTNNNESASTNTNENASTSDSSSNAANTVDSNVANTVDSTAESAGGDSILNSTDETALGANVITTDTQEVTQEVAQALEAEANQAADAAAQQPAAPAPEANGGDVPFAITTTEEFSSGSGEDTAAQNLSSAPQDGFWNFDNPEAGQYDGGTQPDANAVSPSADQPEVTIVSPAPEEQVQAQDNLVPADADPSNINIVSPAPDVPDANVETPAPEVPDVNVETPAPEVPDTNVETPVPEVPDANVETPAPEVPDANVETPAPEATEGSDLPAEPAPAPAELPLDEAHRNFLPDMNANVTGANVLRIRVAGRGIEPAADEFGGFGSIAVSGPAIDRTISLQDPFDPSTYDSSIVAVRDMDAAAAQALGWPEGGTEIFISLGDALAGFDDTYPQCQISISNLTLVQKAEDGTVTATGVLNGSAPVYKDTIGLTFDDLWDISGLQAGGVLSGHVIMPDNAEEAGIFYTSYIESSGISFQMGEDGRSFTATLMTPGDNQVTVYVSADGGASYTPYSFIIPVMTAG